MFSPFAFLPGAFEWTSFLFGVDGVQTMVHRARSFVHDLPARVFTLPHRPRGFKSMTHQKRNFWVGK